MKSLKKFSLAVCLYALALNAWSAEVLHYVLAPGSTITPCEGPTATGPTEALTGRLDWVLYSAPIPETIIAFDAVDLDFQSASFRLTLNRTSANDVMTAVHTDSSLTVFDEVVDCSGLNLPVAGLMGLDPPGAYAGPPTRPNVLNYPNVAAGPLGGGVFAAKLRLIVVMEDLLNVAPSFTKGPDITVLQNCGAQTIAEWAIDITAGPPREAGQTVAFTVTADNASLFAAGPAISPDGTLTFRPALNRSGTSHVTVVLQDNGGTAYGGQDTSVPQTFTITVLSPAQALGLLIADVERADLGRINKRPLLASLYAARAALQRGNSRAAINELRAFESKLQVQVAPVYPDLAQEWISEAEAIIGTFAGASSKPVQPARAAASLPQL